jgi:predicted transcriptional regulator of viral defense system
MSEHAQRLSGMPATFTTAQARDQGLTSRILASLVAADQVEELSRGVYRRSDAPASAHLDLLAVHARAPRAVICGESALALHELIDDIPLEVHIAVRRGAHRPSIAYPPVRVAQYAADTFDLGIRRFEAAPGETVPVYGPARAAVDALRLGGSANRPLALSALNRYLRRYGAGGVAELRETAERLGALSRIRPVIEAVLA